MNGAAITVPKRGRREQGEVCQDAAVVVHRRNGVVLAVADGVSTAPRSELGAVSATRLIADRLADVPSTDPDVVDRALRHGRDAWLAHLRDEQAPLSASKVTFAFAVVLPPSFAVGAVGDCFVAASRGAIQAPSWHLLVNTGRVPGAFRNEVHVTLGDPEWRSELRLFEVLDPTINAVAVSSDGLEPVAVREDVVRGTTVEQVGVVESFADWLVDRVRKDQPGPAIADELESWDELMIETGDDLGIALAAW
ncbi:MAG TPA: protein phosphatase 2C domain-containing protein [Thermoleophilaceae bacterium]